jgi:hypothetical protein
MAGVEPIALMVSAATAKIIPFASFIAGRGMNLQRRYHPYSPCYVLKTQGLPDSLASRPTIQRYLAGFSGAGFPSSGQAFPFAEKEKGASRFSGCSPVAA